MTTNVRPIPEGYHTVTPHLIIRGAGEAIDYYKRAFGAQELFRMPAPDGRLAHAEIRIGDSVIMLSDEFSEMGSRSPQSLGGSCGGLMLYVEDCDRVFGQAIEAGGRAVMPLQDMFWGDRYGKLSDPFGHTWAIATHKEDLAPEEIAQRSKAAMAAMSPGQS